MSNPAEYEKPPPYSPSSIMTDNLPQQPPGYTAYPPAGYPSGAPSYPPYTQSPAPGYQPYVTQPTSGYQPTYGATTITVQPQEIIIVGACPACRIGVLEDDYTCLGIFCAIFFFPLGILACLALKNRRCTNCGAYFG